MPRTPSVADTAAHVRRRRTTGLDRSAPLSAEVLWYLETRGIPVPDIPPLIRTPEPAAVEGAVFIPERVDKVLTTFRALQHTQGQWAGKPLTPDPWQVAYILAPVFGWCRWDEDANDYVRIVRNLYVEVSRKAGKSTLLGGIAIYMAFADGEPGAQVIAAATSEKQAKFVFEPIRTLAGKSPALKRHVKALRGRINQASTGSYIEVVASVADALHGANLHCAVVDELHVHKDPELLETIETGTGSRTQPLVAVITTADSGVQGTIYDRRRKQVEQLAGGTITDETRYGVVWAAEETDDPFVEETWRKANPGYGISPSASYLKAASNEARNSPAELAKFLRLHLGVRTKQETKYLDLAAWDRNAGLPIDEGRLTGRIAYGGLDLAATSDLSALCWDFPDDDGGHDLLWRIWVPESGFSRLRKRLGATADVWRDEGLVTVTPGDVADYDFIRAQINVDREKFDVQNIAYDPWNSSQLVTDLSEKDGLPMTKLRQSVQSLSGPTKEMQRLILTGKDEKPLYRHGGNSAIRWQVDNFAVAMDAAGNVKPDKAKAGDKIDGIVAAVIALALSMGHQPPVQSAYEDGFLRVV